MAISDSRVLRIGLAGIGAMGSQFGLRILGAGHKLLVLPHNNLIRANALVQAGAQVGASAADVAAESDIFIASLPDVPQVREVLLGERGLIAGARAGLLF